MINTMEWKTTNREMESVTVEAVTDTPIAEMPKALNLQPESERAWMKEHDPSALQYVGNGAWDMYEEDGIWHIDVNVGCHCAGDCCGHICSTHYEITPMSDGMNHVELRIGFNY